MRTRRAMEADRLWKSLRDSHNPWKTLRVSHSSHSADDDELNQMSAKAGQGQTSGGGWALGGWEARVGARPWLT